jgi:hypothetical protein
MRAVLRAVMSAMASSADISARRLQQIVDYGSDRKTLAPSSSTSSSSTNGIKHGKPPSKRQRLTLSHNIPDVLLRE